PRALRRSRDRVSRPRARRRIRDLQRQGAAAPGVDADAIWARLRRRRRTVAEVRTRRLGTDGPEVTTVGFGAWAIGGPWKFGWGTLGDAQAVGAILHAHEVCVEWGHIA